MTQVNKKVTRRFSKLRGACLPTLFLFATALQGASILSNYPSSGDIGGGALLGLAVRSFSQGFSMPVGDSYTLDSVTYRLAVNAAGGSFFLELFGGFPDPTGPSLVSFGVPTFNTLGVADYTFTPNTSVTLSPSTTYWLAAYGTTTGSSNQITFTQSGTPIAPSGYATFAGARFNSSPATVPATGSSARLTTMQINATAITSGVPEPATYGIVLSGIGILALMRGRASRRR